MLATPRNLSERQPQPTSLRQQYADFIEQRIEEFKEQLSRQKLLSLGDEAVRELEVAPTDQLVLTEVLVHDHVDRIIKNRLKLPTFRRWRERHVKLRRAQQQPTHWGLDTDTPLKGLAHCLEEHDLALVVGAGAEPAGLFLAAHDARVLFIDRELPFVEAAESRAASESLGLRFEALVVAFGAWFPPEVEPAVVVIDPLTLGKLERPLMTELVNLLQERTVGGGAHVITTSPGAQDVVPVAPDAMQSMYNGWVVDRGSRAGRTRWFSARKPQ